MMNSGVIQPSQQPFFYMRQALIEAKLITKKHASDAVYVTTLAEELRDIEAKISALEGADIPGRSSSEEVGPETLTQSLPGAEWIQCKACELEARLRRIQPPSVQTKASAASLDGRTSNHWRAVPRYPATQKRSAGKKSL